MFYCYSDASFREDGAAGYGVVIVNSGVRRLMKGVMSDIASALDAELEAMIIGLQQVPAGSDGFCYSDLRDIERMLAGEVRCRGTHRERVNTLRSHLVRTGLVVRYVPRGVRSHHYTDCHRAAARALRLDKDGPPITHAAKSVPSSPLPAINKTPRKLRGGGVRTPGTLILNAAEWNATLGTE